MLARTFHDFYRDLCRANGWAIRYDMDYEQLPATIQAEYVAAAERMPRVLKAANLMLVPKDHPDALDVEKTRELVQQKMEILSEAEHKGWMEHRKAQDWHLGAMRDDEKKISPWLIPYSELPELEKEKDRSNVRHYPDIADMTGMAIAKD